MQCIIYYGLYYKGEVAGHRSPIIIIITLMAPSMATN